VSRTTPRVLGRVPIGSTVGHDAQGPTEVEAIGIGTRDGIAATILTYGGHLTDLLVPDRRGRRTNVVLRLADLRAYEDNERSEWCGALVGRYANRISASRFTLDGIEHRLAPNEGPNHLHGGPVGFDRYVWDVEPLEDDDGVDVVLRHTSPSGDQGYPGTVAVEARYRLDRDDRLTISFEATTDAPTPISLTQHAYWNLAGGGAVTGHVVQAAASHYVEVDDQSLPTGELRPVRGTRLDFRGGRRVPPGIDHCLVLDEADPQIVVVDPGSGRRLQVTTDLPGIQVYVGSPIDPPDGGLCLESQHLPDAPNHPSFPSPVVRPGEVYRSRTEFRFDSL
jgi:aldose 1-epimerase